MANRPCRNLQSGLSTANRPCRNLQSGLSTANRPCRNLQSGLSTANRSCGNLQSRQPSANPPCRNVQRGIRTVKEAGAAQEGQYLGQESSDISEIGIVSDLRQFLPQVWQVG